MDGFLPYHPAEGGLVATGGLLGKDDDLSFGHVGIGRTGPGFHIHP